MAQEQGTQTGMSTQIYEIYIRAAPQAIWDAITTPEWTAKYGYGGLVEEVTLRYVRLRDYEGQVHFIPNGIISTVTTKTMGHSYAVVEGGMPEPLPATPSGRADKDAAEHAFPVAKADVEAHPESWRSWLRLSMAYDAARDRKRARMAARKALELRRLRETGAQEAP